MNKRGLQPENKFLYIPLYWPKRIMGSRKMQIVPICAHTDLQMKERMWFGAIGSSMHFFGSMACKRRKTLYYTIRKLIAFFIRLYHQGV
jgi:hypothetical protein